VTRLIQDGAVLDVTKSTKPVKKTQVEVFMDDLTWIKVPNEIEIAISGRPYETIIMNLSIIGCTRIVSVMSGDVKENPEKIGKLTIQEKMKWNHISLKEISINLSDSVEKELQSLLSDIQKGEKILIHCQNGIEKSGIIFYHLMMKMEMKSEDSLNILRECNRVSAESVEKLMK
jgi:ABC-type siderophore export system fused ATPase/permease subunit